MSLSPNKICSPFTLGKYLPVAMDVPVVKFNFSVRENLRRHLHVDSPPRSKMTPMVVQTCSLLHPVNNLLQT
jgi:hypothetical protein